MRAWTFPGQGSQRKGMGAELFDRFPDEVAVADDVLGLSVRELCLEDPRRGLADTRWAQPAIFVVNALAHRALADSEPAPDYLAGHSLGEYNALLAAGCFDFATGLRLVRRRAELMAEAVGGGMAALVGLDPDEVTAVLRRSGLDDRVEIANENSATQVVVSGDAEAVVAVRRAVRELPGARCLPLNVSGAFHSRHMAEAARRFGDHLAGVEFRDPVVPVIANATAEPYPAGGVARLLARQVDSRVLWRRSMRELVRRGVTEVREVGGTTVLDPFWRSALEEGAITGTTTGDAGTRGNGAALGGGADWNEAHGNDRLVAATLPGRPRVSGAAGLAGMSGLPGVADPPDVLGVPGSLACDTDPGAAALGSARFRSEFGVRYAYLAGSMFRGISSVELVSRMGAAGLMGYFGSGGLGLAEVERAVRRLAGTPGLPFGVNLLHDLTDPAGEEALVDVLLRNDVRFVEAAAFTAVTPAVVRFRFSGAHRRPDGTPVAVRRVLAKVSRPEVAAAFMAPPPADLLRGLVDRGALTRAEADVARRLPVAGEVCAEADSGGHTDGAVAFTLVPSLVRARDRAVAEHGYPDGVHLGASGGLGAPEAVAAAFVLGADFVVTGSVNQCSPEAGTSDTVKDLLSTLDVQDTAYAPAGDLFELGSKVQVVRKGTLFAARANRLYQLYRQHAGLEELDPRTRAALERDHFRAPLDEVWARTRRHYLDTGRAHQVERAERDPKHRMALVFKAYFARTSRLAAAGDEAERVNFQVHCGPAIGAFNRFVAGTPLQDWRARHVELIAERLMAGAARVLRERRAAPTDAAPRPVEEYQ
ncbi:ACP S-malonyltransferase [Actinosynnema sp. NPDC050801]|uniref:ACP S-malonyltransferase n=1 Tax=unclassified Actinosynnema TaxID=2637065 RepID=UPI0034037FA2